MRGLFSQLEPFSCFACHTEIGFTAPGEAKRINTRAHVFCPNCRTARPPLTERQQQLLDTLAVMRAEGVRPTVGGAGDRMGLSRSRAQQLRMSVVSRGYATELAELLGGVVPAMTGDDYADDGWDDDEPAVSSVDDAPTLADLEISPGFSDLPLPPPVFSPPPTSAASPTEADPASFGGEFVV